MLLSLRAVVSLHGCSTVTHGKIHHRKDPAEQNADWHYRKWKETTKWGRQGWQNLKINTSWHIFSCNILKTDRLVKFSSHLEVDYSSNTGLNELEKKICVVDLNRTYTYVADMIKWECLVVICVYAHNPSELLSLAGFITPDFVFSAPFHLHLAYTVNIWTGTLTVFQLTNSPLRGSGRCFMNTPVTVFTMNLP